MSGLRRWYGLHIGQASESRSPAICDEPRNATTKLQLGASGRYHSWEKWSARPIREAQLAITRPLSLPTPLTTLRINLPEHAGTLVLARADCRKNTEYKRQWPGHSNNMMDRAKRQDEDQDFSSLAIAARAELTLTPNIVRSCQCSEVPTQHPDPAV